MDYSVFSRIILRYVVGGMIMGSESIGERLSANPDLVVVVSLGIGAAVEAAYVLAKRKGWKT